MKNDHKLLLIPLESGTLTKDKFISVIETCNQIILDMSLFNNKIISDVFSDDNPKTREEFFKQYNINIPHQVKNPDNSFISLRNIEYDNIRLTFRFPGFNNKLRDELDKAIKVGYIKMYETLSKKIDQQQTTILTHNNDPDGGGRHIAPNNVNI